jgi:drug/metabolite transporter (DMT)-like permease
MTPEPLMDNNTALIKNKRYVLCAFAAALLYALNAPVSKLLLNDIPATLLAGILYLGAGAGVFLLRVLSPNRKKEAALSRADLPYTVGMVVLDVAAPILLMLGLSTSSAASAVLLNNFEIVATAVFALTFFGEKISARLWAAIGLITTASILLSVDGATGLGFSFGSLLILLACVCWGLENNCTRRLSSKDPMQIVIIKGLCSGAASLSIGLAVGERTTDVLTVIAALVLGFFAYGLSIYFYVFAQRRLGASKTSAFYASSPFIGTALSLAIFREPPSLLYIVSFIIMAAGAYLAAIDS